jgi:hypothetical protein
MCSGLRNRSYCYKNTQYSPEEYLNIVGRYDLGSYAEVQRAYQEFESFIEPLPALFANFIRVEEVTGDNISEARRCENVFDGSMLEDTLNSQFVQECKDTGDVNFGFQQSLHYESMMVGAGSSDVAFCIDTWPNVSHLYYSVFCENSHHCFGCNGLQRAEYCILNKQYTKEEYEVLVPRIIAHMRLTEEWGEFYPPGLLGTGYQESLAMCDFPLTEQEVKARNFTWSTYVAPPPAIERIVEARDLPDSIDEVTSYIINLGIRCGVSGKIFRIISRELHFYQSYKIPLPRLHPYERYVKRVRARNPRRLWTRRCERCSTELRTSYDPKSARHVVCQSCFERDAY